jgi:hypothetical protein
MSAGYRPSIRMVPCQRPETATLGARRPQVSLQAILDPSDVERFGGIGAASNRSKSEEPPLLLPVVRQFPGKRYKPCWRQLGGLLADQDRANDFGR